MNMMNIYEYNEYDALIMWQCYYCRFVVIDYKIIIFFLSVFQTAKITNLAKFLADILYDSSSNQLSTWWYHVVLVDCSDHKLTFQVYYDNIFFCILFLFFIVWKESYLNFLTASFQWKDELLLVTDVNVTSCCAAKYNLK